jgi:hypothetical protein
MTSFEKWPRRIVNGRTEGGDASACLKVALRCSTRPAAEYFKSRAREMVRNCEEIVRFRRGMTSASDSRVLWGTLSR